MRWGIRFVLLSATLALAFPGSAGAFGPLSSFGEFGGGPGQLDAPAQLAVAPNGDIYVADRGNDRISVFAGDGAFLGTFGRGILQEPRDMALGASRVFVADTGNNRIDVFSTEGSFLFAFGKGVGGAGVDVCETSCQPGAAESAAGAITNPTGVFADGSRIYVANGEFSRIDVFSSAGAFLYAFGKEVNASDASDVCDAVDGCQAGANSGLGAMLTPMDVIVGGDGNVYVADFGNERVDNFTQQGTFLRFIGEEGLGALSGPVALAWDDAPEGVYVADQLAQRVERFSVGGFSLGGFAAEPNIVGVGLACQGNVFAVEQDTLLARIERFGEPGTPLPPCVGPPPGEPIGVSLIRVPSNKFRFAGLVKNRRNGSAVLFVRVPGPGKVILKGRGVRRLSRGAPRAMRVRLPVKPKVRLKRFLRKHGKGRIRVEVTFKPVGGTPLMREKPIVLKRKRR